MLIPQEYFQRISEIPESLFRENGLRGALLDIDGTLAPDGSQEIPPDVRAWLDRLPSWGVKAAVVSNNREERVRPFAQSNGLAFVAHAGKPLRRGLSASLETVGCRASECAVIGDQLFTDIWFAARSGCFAVLVEPMSPDLYPFVKFKRALEQPFRRKIREGMRLPWKK